MNNKIASACAIALVAVSVPAAMAGPAETKFYRQNAPVNVKIVVLDGPSTAGARIEQTGRYNAAAIVSRSGGGYGAIYQSGIENTAFAGRGGRDVRTDIRQIQTAPPPAYVPRILRGWRRR